MPSVLIGNMSGGQPLFSGNPFSGTIRPIGGIQLKLGWQASGFAYVSLSGNMTVNSGVLASGGVNSGGLLDGVQMKGGDTYFVPRLALQVGAPSFQAVSGAGNIYLACDAAASGQAYMYYEVF